MTFGRPERRLLPTGTTTYLILGQIVDQHQGGCDDAQC